ncbi:MAG: hypothetical protein ACK4GL_12685 [Flavobacteriales bacterium]
MNHTIHAKNGRSIVTIICSNGKPFGASLNNGEILYSTKQINFTFLASGDHYLEVYRSLSTPSGLEQQSQTIYRGGIQVAADMHQIYTINHKSILILTESLPLNYPSSALMNPVDMLRVNNEHLISNHEKSITGSDFVLHKNRGIEINHQFLVLIAKRSKRLDKDFC